MTMSVGSPVEHIDTVDAFARTLYLRLKTSPNSNADPPLDDVALAVRQLHLALRHLRVEAADQDSALNRPDSSTLYARQLESLVEDCGFQLRQLDAALATIDIYGTGGEEGVVSGNGSTRAERLGNLRAKITNEKTSIDMFLDTIQLRNPAKQPAGIVDGSHLGLENIKNKVDNIANRLFAHRNADGNNSFADDEDRLWQEFKSELEKEGFSPQVLRRHKEVLRAYIRELETMSQQTGGLPPTVRGLLEHEAKTLPASSPKEMYPAIENEKFPTSMKDERRMPDSAPLVRLAAPQSSYDREQRGSLSSDDSVAIEGGDSMALISTRDLMAMDHLNAGLANMHLQPSNQHYSTSPANGQKFLPSSAPTSGIAELAGSPGSMALSASPRSAHALPPYTSPQLPAYSSPRTSVSSRLAPDSHGNEIPMEAQWTKVRRTLISLEVLDRARVRYEARPEYVAILGRLSREEIAEFARLSAETRAARSRGYAQHKRYDKYDQRERADSKSSYEDDDDDESVLWDESDSTDVDDDKTSDKGTKSYPYIVNFPEKEGGKTSPSSTAQPKSILKNKNGHHVRFDPQPHEFDARPSSWSPDRPRDPDRHDREPRSSRRYRDDEDRHSRRYHPEGGRNRRSVDGERGGDRYYRRRGGGGNSGRDREHQRYHRERDRDRDRDRDRNEESRKEEKSSRKKAWGETLGAVGIGGAAVSLLGVLAEAAI